MTVTSLPGVIGRNARGRFVIHEYDKMPRTGVCLEFHHTVKFQKDRYLEIEDMRTMSVR